MEKNNNKLSIIALVFAIIAALVSFYTCYSTDKLCNIFSNEETESVQTITSAGEVIDEPATIDDVLQFRRDTKEYERYDSIFMNMPDVALIAILMKGGTNMSNRWPRWRHRNDLTVSSSQNGKSLSSRRLRC